MHQILISNDHKFFLVLLYHAQEPLVELLQEDNFQKDIRRALLVLHLIVG